MLPRKNRLTKKKDFEAVFKTGKGIKSGFLLCKVAKNGSFESRIGIVVSKKVSPKATVRNRVKRMLKGAAEISLKKIKSGIDVVIVTFPGIEKKEFADVEQMLARALKKYYF